jgi:hypothetical protein
MHKSKAKRIQQLLVDHLMNCGNIHLRLPDGVSLEIDITQESKHGVEIADNYCCVTTTRDGNETMLDSYNLGMKYVESSKTLLCMDSSTDDVGRTVKRLEVV